ncbi:WAS/WASL-interacting protein family member 1-like isoform X5 [Canis lupus familiaris]|uniref:WAS/WASL-interacting protein family member 1-like isoform X5 n=1 Tax=Canis lupus familiaris TaxID=9615 RepID=UPI0018F4B29A|nr:WAS/WASL-interacting protein family member 1-like isoform X5 [Canis lupus familiaris]
MRGARRGTRSRDPRTTPWAEGGAKPPRRPGSLAVLSVSVQGARDRAAGRSPPAPPPQPRPPPAGPTDHAASPARHKGALAAPPPAARRGSTAPLPASFQPRLREKKVLRGTIEVPDVKSGSVETRSPRSDALREASCHVERLPRQGAEVPADSHVVCHPGSGSVSPGQAFG